ncbi:PAS domain S-box-containing protein [Caulobacter ginsengisoli]|uniref:histidine kinase n=1 Tax=Caulobacter ginsengisoli TaxID=400775 RepID=A0ABU0IVB5_9CAUL|nr:ATP-binding protein [Caulobacter ginsengisoli]MDQ0465954.1 PAS domain S-box-containing protein [Caulobacter ginsengisoli]
MTLPEKAVAAGGAGEGARAIGAGRWDGAPRAVSFARRMDEAAAAIHPVTPVKMVLGLLGGLMGLFLLPWQASAAWVAGNLGLEVWGWFATRIQARRQPIGWRTRANFLANYGATNLWWLTLSLMFWATGTPAGEATGLAMLIAVGLVCVLLYYNAPVVFLAAGILPAGASLSLMVIAQGGDWRQLAPVWMALGLSAIFNLGRALETPSVQQAQRRLNANLNSYQVLAENVTDIIVRCDMEGRHQYVSPASLSVLGYDPETLIGMQRMDFIHPDDHAQVAAGVGRMLADHRRSEAFTLRVRHREGHWLWLQCNAKLVCEDGVPVGVIDISRDVTGKVAADAALLEAKAEAESANQAKAEFLANVSHEIRTPMNGVLGALTLLERETISLEGRELMRQAQDCGRMLSQLLNDVLDFSKIEAGQLDLVPEPTDPAEALRAVVGLLEGQARAKGVALTCDIQGEGLWIAVDPVRLRQAMFNLLGNAVKFTSRGHVAARLAVSDESGRRHVRLEVEDTGIGMSAQAQSHLFERFRQGESDTARRFGGAGLGLSITQALAQMMGGEIGFTSREGQGSTFWLDFDAPAADQVAAPAMGEDLLEGLTLLLVDDNATNRLMARTLLTRLGARIHEAEDGASALDAARNGVFDLILMDIQMPRMDGVEATRAIRALPGEAARTPIIGLTANVMVHQKAQYLAAGMDGVVAKPIAPAALLAEIARLIAGEDERLAG